MRQILALIIVLGMGSCYYDVEEELYPTIECATEDIQYQRDILPILVDNCLNCHSAAANFGNITLEGYDRLIPFIENNELVGAIKHSAGFSPMPKNAPKLLDCEIEKIEAWIDAGALNN